MTSKNDDPEAARAAAEKLGAALDGLQGGRDEGAHPDTETLLAHAAGEGDPDRREALERHLLGCGLCRELFLDAVGFVDPEEPAISEPEAEALLARTRARLPEANPRARASSGFGLRALAASLAVVAVGLGFWVASLRQTLEEESGLRATTWIDLDPVRSSGPPGEAGWQLVEASERNQRLAFELTPDLDPVPSLLQVTIYTEEGRVVDRFKMTPNPEQRIAFSLSHRLMPEGRYRIKVGPAGGEAAQEDEDTRHIQVRYGEGPPP